MNFRKIKITAALMGFVLAFGLTGCRLTPEANVPADETAPAEVTAAPEVSEQPDITYEPEATAWPGNEQADGKSVIMRCGDTEFMLYDFGQAFYSSQYLQYYMYGMVTPDQYCDMVIDELKGLMYMVAAAKDAGIELTQDEIDEIDSNIADYVEQVKVSYRDYVEEGVDDVEAAALAMLEEDLAQDGLDLDSFVVLAANNLRIHKIAEKYYETLQESVSVSDDDVRTYLDEKLETAPDESVSDFVADMNGYYEGSAPYPVYIVDDCFSVNHIYMGFESSTDDEGNIVYDTESRAEDEAEVEAKIEEAADYDAFMELETVYGEDPGMDSETYRENGYIIHGDLVNDYFAGFVYAAMNLHEGEWSVPVDGGASDEPAPAEPELAFFTLKDGTRVVKVCTESGVHYIIVNKEYKRGPVKYTVGDEIWESWRDAATETRMSDLYDTLSEEWRGKYSIDTDVFTIKAHYPPADDFYEDPDSK